MREEQVKNNSLVKVENKSLKEIGKRAMPKVSDSIKRLGKIAGWGTLATVGAGAFILGSAPVSAIRNSYFSRSRF